MVWLRMWAKSARPFVGSSTRNQRMVVFCMVSYQDNGRCNVTETFWRTAANTSQLLNQIK